MGFSEQLKKARLAVGYTQQQIADIMGITKSTYCGYETGKRQPDVTKIKQLAKILNTSGDTLLETGFEKEIATQTMNFSIEEKRIIEHYRKADEIEKEMVRRILHIRAKESKEELA